MVFQKLRPHNVEFGSSDFIDDFEQVVYCSDAKVGLKAIIALHSTVLGPATGGCRMWNYGNENEALTDVLRLSRGMTYKASISGLNWGGGKAVIIGDSKKNKTRAMLERFGEFVDRLGGNYITAKDVGIGSDDLKIVKTKTPHVLGIDDARSSGDPSPATAWGVYHGMKACAKKAFGTSSLKGLRIAMQGLGSVSFYMLEHLYKEGAQVVGCDIDAAAIDRATQKYGVEIVRPDAIYEVPCDIFAPCALGATINTKTLPRIKAKVIAGAANNQLETLADGMAVQKRGILYAPDYAINAGGLINIYYEGVASKDTGGVYNRAKAFEHVARIEQTIADILDRAEAEHLSSDVIADRMAEERVANARRR